MMVLSTHVLVFRATQWMLFEEVVCPKPKTVKGMGLGVLDLWIDIGAYQLTYIVLRAPD